MIKVLTLYQKLVLKLLNAILWRLVNSRTLNTGSYIETDKIHNNLMCVVQRELDE